MKKLTVVGDGVLGSQIAFQSAVMGYDVTTWFRIKASIERGKPKFARLHDISWQSLKQRRSNVAILKL